MRIVMFLKIYYKLMEKIIDYQKEKLDKFYKISEDFLYNLNNATLLRHESQLLLIDKLRLLNNKLSLIEDDINDILYDIKRRKCSLSMSARVRLREEEESNNLIREMSPILLYYLMNRDSIGSI
jgi:hypothetical protein